MPAPPKSAVFHQPPDPGQAATLDDIVEQLRLLKVWAGNPSYEVIKDRINAAWSKTGRPAVELTRKTTVVDCFRPGRRRLNTDLVVAIVEALHPDVGYVSQWRQALRIIGGEATAASQVRVHDQLPHDLADFTGRTGELDRLRAALRRRIPTGMVGVIEGMAGIGKTRLAVRAARLLAAERPFDHVLFVNLRGFHPDPAQPPVDPDAVLDGFLRLLGVPAHQIPHALPNRAAAYRRRVAGTRALVVLDDAADADQVRPLLAEVPDCVTLITSRRRLAPLPPGVRLRLDVFTPDEAVAYLADAVPGTPVGTDPQATARIARLCGHLPLALGLVAAHIRSRPGWTLTDHADRLAERHRNRRLDTGVELALDLSYRRLPNGHRRTLRLIALHPGQDLDPYAAAALADVSLPAARAHLNELHRDHVVQSAAPGRYALHDVLRAYALNQAGDEDPPPVRRTALTRLFDYYLSTAAAAMDVLHPAEAHRRPRISAPTTPMPALPDAATARAWLDAERDTLVAVAVHTTAQGWPHHATRLSATLFRYLNGGYYSEALIVHGRARDAARDLGDVAGQATALTNLGAACVQTGRFEQATDHLEQALKLHRQIDDDTGQARVLTNLGVIEARLGRYRQAARRHEAALAGYRRAGDLTGEARALGNLGFAEARLGDHLNAAERYAQARDLCRRTGDRTGEASMLGNLGDVELQLERYDAAREHIEQARSVYQERGDRDGEAWTLTSLGVLETLLGRPGPATDHHRRALEVFRRAGARDGETYALNGLGEAAEAYDSLAHHGAALDIAAEIGAADQQARAHAGLGRAWHRLGDADQARRHYGAALALYGQLGMPQAEDIRTQLETIAAEGTASS
ncbi:tetratricopeptide repeat protein [Micromonospora sp. B11E3]|uniref:tetratricopeptide repeat protein n=1 Tax=Micromonospora sp. B11E3 TaxID=3153562 RepID=UPI00325E0844